MGINNSMDPQDCLYGSTDIELNEIVMGLHWDPQQNKASVVPQNLDALCVLLDREGRAVEIVHPGSPRSANGSVIHTGDAQTGASEWDDERIFVFLNALPAEIFAVVFVVISATGGAFGEIRGAYCHVSDRITEREWFRVELTALGRETAHCVAFLRRSPSGWEISADAQPGGSLAVPELLSLARSVNTQNP